PSVFTSDLQSAQSSVESDQSALNAAQVALTNLPNTYASDLQTAQSAADVARSALATEQGARNAAASPNTTSLSSAQAAVTRAQANLDAANSTLLGLQNGISTGSSGGVCARTSSSATRADPAGCDAALRAAASTVSASQQDLTNAQNSLNLA